MFRLYEIDTRLTKSDENVFKYRASLILVIYLRGTFNR